MPWGLFGGLARIEITLNQPMYVAGETVRATIVVHALQDVELRAAHASLVFDNRYTYRTRRRTKNGTTTVSSSASDTRVAHSIAFLSAGTLASGSQQQFELEFPSLHDMPPTAVGAITSIDWSIQVKLDIPNAVDATASVPVVLLSRSETYASWATDETFGSDQNACLIDLHLEQQVVRPGDTLNGMVTITPRSDFSATDFRVELVRREEVPRDQGNLAEESVSSVILMENPTITGGMVYELPLQLPVPPTASASYRTDNAAVHWAIKAVVARRFRTDFHALKEVVIFNGPADA